MTKQCSETFLCLGHIPKYKLQTKQFLILQVYKQSYMYIQLKLSKIFLRHSKMLFYEQTTKLFCHHYVTLFIVQNIVLCHLHCHLCHCPYWCNLYVILHLSIANYCLTICSVSWNMLINMIDVSHLQGQASQLRGLCPLCPLVPTPLVASCVAASCS